MAVTRHVAEFDIVELLDRVAAAPAGARGGVIDLLDNRMAMVEVTSLPAELGVDRIVVAPLDLLRVVAPAHA